MEFRCTNEKAVSSKGLAMRQVTESKTTNPQRLSSHSHLQLHEVSQGAHDLDDLLRELTGGCEHERLALNRGNVDLLKDRHREGGGLTGTCHARWNEKDRPGG